MKHLSVLLSAIILVMLSLNSCKSPKEKSLNEIKILEKSFADNPNGGYDKGKAKSLADAYAEFALKYPDDTASAAYTYQAAEILVSLTEYNRAVALFDTAILKYPKSRDASMCLFLKAFVLDDKLKDLPKAKLAYEEFLQKYPNHRFAADARVCLQNLGKSPEEILKGFNQN